MSPDIVEKPWSRGGCPRCAAAAPLKLIIAGRGKPFLCAGCKAKLVTSKLGAGMGAAIGGAGIIWFKSTAFPLIPIILLLTAAAIAEWAMLKVHLIEE